MQDSLSQETSYTRLDYFYDLPGTAPGTLSTSSSQPSPKLILIDYSADTAMRMFISAPHEAQSYLDQESISWLDVQGLGNLDVLQQVGKIFQLHPLILEDVVNVPQRPKVERYGNQLVIITQMITLIPGSQRYASEQISLILGPNYLLTVQEEPNFDCFESIRSRIQLDKGTIRQMKADYLAYALLDAIVDGFFPVLEAYGERLESLEDEVLVKPNQRVLRDIYRLKREMSALRHFIWLQRDTLATLSREHSDFVSRELEIYLRDCYDHAVQLLDIVESYRDACAGLMDIHLSVVSNRMNEVMKTLTVISTIFIPLTFIAGIYGMNFNSATSPLNMPELNWYWGYPFVWFVMVAISLSLIYFFWRRGWFRNFL